MTGRLYFTNETVDEPIEELSLVVLTRSVFVPDADRTLPVGARGTVVGVWKSGEAYIIEFTEPFAALLDLVATDISAVPGGSRAELVARHMAHRAS